MKETSWVIAHDGTGDKAYALECLRCGAVQTFETPLPVDYWVSVAKVFERAHRKCRERMEGTNDQKTRIGSIA